MDTIEILIIVGASILVGFLVVGFIADWDYSDLGGAIRRQMLGEDATIKTDTSEFAAKLSRYAADCYRDGKGQRKAFHITGNGTFSKKDVFDILKGMGWCESVQSLENSCGTREDIIMGTITLPKVVGLSCESSVTKVS